MRSCPSMTGSTCQIGRASPACATWSAVRASVTSTLNSALRADFVVGSGTQAGGSSGLSPDLERSLAALPQVSDVAGIRSGIVKVFGTVTPVASGKHLHLGSTVAVTYPTTGTKDYTVQVIYGVRDIAGDYVLPIAAARANFPSSLDIAIFVKLAPGVTASAARPAISRVLAGYPNATLQDQDQYKASQASQVNTLLDLVYALLALSLLIALIGIANTLALSIHERTHELGLLRAVGMTRGQLRGSACCAYAAASSSGGGGTS